MVGKGTALHQQQRVDATNWEAHFAGLHLTIELYGRDDSNNPRCRWTGGDTWDMGWQDPRPGNATQRTRIATDLQQRGNPFLDWVRQTIAAWT